MKELGIFFGVAALIILAVLFFWFVVIKWILLPVILVIIHAIKA